MKDYYAILGITSAEDEAGIRHAFRDLAMRLHPDRAGAASKEAFQEIAEAYSVLGDRDRRAAYDRTRGKSASGDSRRRPPPSAGVVAEPFFRGSRSRGFGWPLRGRRHGHGPDDASAGDFGIAGVEVGSRAPWRRAGAGPLKVVVQLSRLEAAAGGDLHLPVPRRSPCPLCGGAHRRCRRCHGTGAVWDESVVRVRIPPRITDGSRLDLPLHGPGVEGRWIEMTIEVVGPDGAAWRR